VRAKQAVARLKLKQLEHQQELVIKEVEMKMKREMVEVQDEIDQADLEAEIYEQNIEDDEVEENKYMHDITQLNPSAESWSPVHRTRVDWKRREEPNIDKLH
jgi:hypothetical protein